MNESTIDLEAVKDVQQKTWATGDFSVVANVVSPVSGRRPGDGARGRLPAGDRDPSQLSR